MFVLMFFTPVNCQLSVVVFNSSWRCQYFSFFVMPILVTLNTSLIWTMKLTFLTTYTPFCVSCYFFCKYPIDSIFIRSNPTICHLHIAFSYSFSMSATPSVVFQLSSLFNSSCSTAANIFQFKFARLRRSSFVSRGMSNKHDDNVMLS